MEQRYHWQEESASFPMESPDQGQQKVGKTSGKPLLLSMENFKMSSRPPSFCQAGLLNEV